MFSVVARLLSGSPSTSLQEADEQTNTMCSSTKVFTYITRVAQIHGVVVVVLYRVKQSLAVYLSSSDCPLGEIQLCPFLGSFNLRRIIRKKANRLSLSFNARLLLRKPSDGRNGYTQTARKGCRMPCTHTHIDMFFEVGQALGMPGVRQTHARAGMVRCWGVLSTSTDAQRETLCPVNLGAH